MSDSTSIADIPQSAAMVGYYVDGVYAVSTASVRARFPNAVLVPISAVGTDNGIVGDVEPGCITLGYCVEWVRLRRLANADPTLYVNQTYGWAPARAAFKAAGVPEPHWWVANYDGIAVVPAGAVAKQYANPTLTGKHYDLSVVADYWPGVDGPNGEEMISPDQWHALAYGEEMKDGVVLKDAAGKPIPTPIMATLLKASADQTAAIVAAIKAIPGPVAPVIDTPALAAAIAARLPAQSGPPVASQAVKDWWAQLTHWLGLS